MDVKIDSKKKIRVFIFVLFMIIIFFIMIARLFYLQIIKNDYYKQLAEGNRIRVRRIEAPRGKIYDRNGKLLVTNVAGYRLIYLDMKNYKRVMYKEEIEKIRYKERKSKREDLLQEIEKLEKIKKSFFNKKESKLKKIKKRVEKLNERISRVDEVYTKLEGIPEIYYKKIILEQEALLKKQEEIERGKKRKFYKKKNKTEEIEARLKEIKKELENRKKLYTQVEDISKLLNMEEKIVWKRLRESRRLIYFTSELMLKDDLKEKEAHKIMEKLSNYPYLDVVYYPKRKYIYDKLASHVIGYVRSIDEKELKELKNKGYNDRDIIGKKGIEKQYDELLKGKDGFEYIEVNVKNKIVKQIEVESPVAGNDIYITLDFDLQNYMTDEFNGEKGSFIAADANSGEILAMVSSPEYSLNQMTSRLTQEEWEKILYDKNKPLQNRATVGRFPPGSIYKPISAIAFLEAGVTPEETIYDPGYFKLGKFVWKNWKKSGEGYVNLAKSLEVSCNTYYYTLSYKYGYSKIADVSRRFGLGEKTGIDIPEEKSGVFPSPKWKKETTKEPWYTGDTINLSIGQGYLSTTPIQMLAVYENLAKEGKGYKFHLLKKVESIKKEIIEVEPERMKDPKVKRKHYKAVKKGLYDVVNKGTGRRAKIKKIAVSGKTGSAQNHQYKKSHAWFAGYAPSENPEVVFLTFVEGGGSGGGVGAPFTKKFLKKYYEDR